MMFRHIDIFIKENGQINANKCTEKWIKLNEYSIYENIINYDINNLLECGTFRQKFYHYILDINNRPLCKKCDSIIPNERYLKFGKGYSNYCSRDCAKGAGSRSAIKSNLKKYGKKCTLAIPEIREKAEKTFMKKYGVNTPSKSNIIKNNNREKYENVLRERYKDLNIKEIISNKISIFCKICKTYKFIPIHLLHQRYKNDIELCLKCNPLYSTSSMSNIEIEIKNYIKKMINIEENNRTILNGNELDIYIPSHNLAIEFNGIYWHSELYKDKKYHLNKTKSCNKKNIKLIHIWEDDWNFKKDIVKSRLLNELGLIDRRIYARKTKIEEIDSKTSATFLQENHLQGKVNGSIRYGLYYQGELVSLMTFGKKRKNLGQTSKDGEYELLRFCNKLNTIIVGGASKLFKHFIKEIKPIEVISYALFDWTNGPSETLYNNLGFKEVTHTGINYYYIGNKLIRENRFNYRKDKLVKEGFDSSKTEVEIMHERGYYRIFDSGNLKYIKTWN